MAMSLQWSGPEDFDSSDIELDEPVSQGPRPRYGQASIAKLLENAVEERIASKKALKSLTYGRGAPTALESQRRWAARLEAFRSAVLNQDIKTPFTGDDLLRFYDSIIGEPFTPAIRHRSLRYLTSSDHLQGKLRPYQMELPQPLRATIKNTIPYLIEYGQFHWTEDDGFRITRTDVARIKHWFDGAVKEGRLIQGRQNPRVWMGFQIVSKLIKVFVEHGLQNGTRNWDVHASRVLSILLVAATQQRSGDIHLTTKYDETTGFYLKWEDLKVTVTGNEPKLSNLQVIIELRNNKGYKGWKNTSDTRKFQPLNDPALFHVDPCLWIMILAMRTGQTKPSIQEVLRDAFERRDRKVQWNMPTLPVIPMRSKANTCLLLDRPARTYQTLITIKAMGVLAGLVGRVYVHALRLGSTRDQNHIPDAELDAAGFTNDRTRQGIGHSHRAMQAGCTDEYGGGNTAALWSVRSKFSKYKDPKRPLFEKDDQENDSCISSGIPLPTIESMARKAVLRQRSDAQVNSEAARLSGHVGMTSADTNEGFDSPSVGVSDLNLQEDWNQPECEDTGTSPQSLIDPHLLDPDDEDVEVERGQLETLISNAFTTEGEPQEQSTADLELMDDIADSMLDQDASPPELTNEAFVSNFAMLNVVKNDAWHQQFLKVNQQGASYTPEMLQQYPVDSDLLHGKDPPSPFVFHCKKTKGCLYQTTVGSLMAQHNEACDEALVTAAAEKAMADAQGLGLPCPHDGCSTILANSVSLKNHVRDFHTDTADWDPKPCEHGCRPDHFYTTPRAYKRHLQERHSENNRWPVQCSFPQCDEKKNFWTLASLRRHLTTDHSVTEDDELRGYLPNTGVTRKMFVKQQPCPTVAENGTDCGFLFNSRGDMQTHLQAKVHGMSKEEAKEFVDQFAQYEDKQAKQRIYKAVPIKRESGDGTQPSSSKRTRTSTE